MGVLGNFCLFYFFCFFVCLCVRMIMNYDSEDYKKKLLLKTTKFKRNKDVIQIEYTLYNNILTKWKIMNEGLKFAIFSFHIFIYFLNYKLFYFNTNFGGSKITLETDGETI